MNNKQTIPVSAFFPPHVKFNSAANNVMKL